MLSKLPGRPKSNFLRRNVYVSEKDYERLRVIGRGNVSAGIRYLLHRKYPTDPDAA